MPAEFQISLEAAEAYESQFVPALFGEWAAFLVDIAEVRRGHAVLDVACGTGVVARAAAERVGETGRVVGVDRLEAMLSVAARLRPDFEWRLGDAHDLPFPGSSFDVVLCQASLMFMDAPGKALAEMARVVSPKGTAGLQVWGRVESSPGLYPFAQAVKRHAGTEAVELWATYFRFGDLDALIATVEKAGFEVTATQTRLGTVRFPSIDAYVTTEIEGTPLGGFIGDDVQDRIREDTRRDLRQFVTETGVELPIEGHLVAARPR